MPGLDVSLKQTSICVVSATGSVVREGVVDSDPEASSAGGDGGGRSPEYPLIQSDDVLSAGESDRP